MMFIKFPQGFFSVMSVLSLSRKRSGGADRAARGLQGENNPARAGLFAGGLGVSPDERMIASCLARDKIAPTEKARF